MLKFAKTTHRRDIPIANTDELIDNLMKDYKKPEDLIGENGLLKQLTKKLLERGMQATLPYQNHGATTGSESSHCSPFRRILGKLSTPPMLSNP